MSPANTAKLKEDKIAANYINVLNSNNYMARKFMSSIKNGKKYNCPKNLDEKLKNARAKFEDPPIYIIFLVHVSIFILILFGYLRDFLRKIGVEKNLSTQEMEKQKDFVPLFSGFESMFYRNCYVRVRDSWNVPICSAPGDEVMVLDRTSDDYNWTFKMSGSKSRVLNLASYNYLGFAETIGYCADNARTAIDNLGLATAASRSEFGISALQNELETLTAEFMGMEAALCTPMGFATNSMNLPCLAGRGCLILSDKLNHTSLVLACRLSGSTVWIFEHNDPEDLEKKLEKAFTSGQPLTHKPFKKILIVVEGIYSMEGTICRLYEIVQLKKKYKAYLYVDEAHSIGALGETGRGVCEYWGIDPSEIDILMGTFTKSFAGTGGYIAGSRKLIDFIKTHGHSSVYGSTFSPPVAQQIISSMQVIMAQDDTCDGERRLRQLTRNTHYFREKLKQMGFIVYGNRDSPVIPIMVYNFGICYFARECLKRGIGVVVAGAPATPIAAARARFCISASHTKEQIDKALRIIDELGDLAGMKHSRYKYREGETIEYSD